MRAGVSITGAFDDACASFLGGICAADNSRHTMLHRTRAPEELRVVLHVPPTELRKAKIDVLQLRAFRAASRAVFEVARKGDYWKAMTLNGLIVAAALGLDPGPMRAALREGAMGAGISGTGPATAAVCEPSQALRIAGAFRPFGGQVLQARPNNRPAFVVT
jgi:shikimate kinase